MKQPGNNNRNNYRKNKNAKKKKKNRTNNEQREKNICTKHMHGNDADTKKEIDFKKI